jgi:hypothetical protein
MLTLHNDTLSVDILDPVADRHRLGPRFMTGGYVYQVRDARAGNLLAGPEYPDASPSVTNGQGLPEVFQFTLYSSEEEIPERKLIIGVGIVENSARKAATQLHFDSQVEEFCRWEVEQSSPRLCMTTSQQLGHWSLRLRKVVRLEGRTLTLSTEITNTGVGPLPYRWFAHPFFPVPPDHRCSILPAGVALNENPGFALQAGGVLVMKSGHPWAEGHFEVARLPEDPVPFRVSQFHPRLRDIDVRCSFVPTRLAIWANDRTFSFEPFTQGDLVPGRIAQWEITYTFGEPIL